MIQTVESDVGCCQPQATCLRILLAILYAAFRL